MDKKFVPQDHEKQLYSFWEQAGYFNAKADSTKEPFCIILPPPNANADLHVGHAMYVYEDVMIRYQHLKGKEVLWLAGADHAGIETQFVYEKHLKKQGKSRFDFDRKTLFADIWDFVMKNRDTMENQLRTLGFALDWSKKKFTMDPDIVKIVYKTFKHLHEEGLVYRANKLVNYCTSCGTSFSDLEVVDLEITGKLYHIKFPIKGGGDITIATTRPETYFGDVAVMVHPKDERYKNFIGKTVVLPLIDREIPIISDEYVDPEFGTGAVKVTPNHDINDFEIAKRHNLTYPPVIGFDGTMINTNLVDGMKVADARKKIVTMLEEKGYMEKINPHEMVLKKCYRCNTTLEPLPKEQWFINVEPLKKQAIKLVEDDTIQIHPKRFKKQLIQILENFIDWNISRQIVWGIQIPAYRCQNSKFQNLKSKQIKNPKSQNNNWFVSVDPPISCEICGECEFVQDEDTFDTWFSSAQWPFATLKNGENSTLFDKFYPTTVMETGYDILRAWVSRMIMMGYFETKTVPFQHVFLHGMVRDAKGQKMSKSKGNVINPLDVIQEHGADALRAALIFGTKEGGDVVLSDDKIKSMRNFGNKLWNVGRFLEMNEIETSPLRRNVGDPLLKGGPIPKDLPFKGSTLNRAEGSGLGGGMLKELQKEFNSVQKEYHDNFKKFQFAKAFDLMYEFVWHRYADYYIEQLKEDIQNGSIDTLASMQEVFDSSLMMIHPYMPFVTEALWKARKGQETSILDHQFS
ncbi:MAG: valine--tRNA ligase [bacterium]|nr:valine--tRNA ligase [bacterium]